MRKFMPLLVAAGLGLACVSASVAASTANDRSPGTAVDPVAPPVVRPQIQSQAERRASFNKRLTSMISTGEGSRLTDRVLPRAHPTQASRSASAPQPRRSSQPRPKASTPSADPRPFATESVSTIAPPPVTYRAGRGPVPGGAYRAPVLDLVTAPRVPTDDVECLTQAIYYEARNESEEGQAAVAEVVMNRSKARGYPPKICEVVYQRNSRTCQFTFTCDGSIGRSAVNMTAWARAERIARSVYAGHQQRMLPSRSVNYHANYVRPSWGRRLERVRQIGAHIFYGAPLNGGRAPGSDEPPPPRAPAEPLFHRIEALDRAYSLVARAGSPADRTPAS